MQQEQGLGQYPEIGFREILYGACRGHVAIDSNFARATGALDGAYA